jgi:hypothetical protein
MPSEIHTCALDGGGGSPAVNSVRAWQANGAMLRLDSPRVDGWWWHGRRWLRRAAAVRSRRCARCGSGSGEARGDGGQCSAMEVTPESREEVGRVGRRRELAEARARGSGNGGLRTAVLTRGSCDGRAIYS